MKAKEIKKGIYWVGAIDWEIREFHGYLTQRGTTYNAYLIIDEKIVLIDTVKKQFYPEMLERIKSIIDPKKIDIVVSNHTEMDHSGALPDILQICPKALVVCSPNGQKGLKKHYDISKWNLKVVKTKDKINIGKKNLLFVLMQMIHWPDSMATYLEEDKILFSNDAFGQHIASDERWASEYGLDIVMEEAKKYYANIVLLFSRQVNAAIHLLEKIALDIIAPGHGLIWKEENVKKIVSGYTHWSKNDTKEKAVIVYGTMWNSTKLMAEAIYRAFEEKNIPVTLKDLRTNDISDVMTDVVDAKYICIGSPTLNNHVLPSVASFLCYIEGLRPKNRIGIAFGSYGWGGQAVLEIEETFKKLGYPVLESIKVQYIPQDKDLRVIADNIKSKIPINNI